MSNPVAIGLVGLGRWARAHASASHRSPAVEIMSCFSPVEDQRSAFSAEHRIPKTATSYEAMLTDPDIAALVISTPNDLHVEMALAAVEANKPVLVDKPMSVDIASGLELLRAAPSGTQLGVAHHPRRLAGQRAAGRWIESGEAGSVRLAYANFSNARGAYLNQDSWYASVAGAEAGVLIQVGIHQVDNMLSLLGPAVAVNARFQHRTLGFMPDATVVVIQHASGAESVVSSSWTSPSHYSTEIQATGGNFCHRLDHRHWTSGDVDDHGAATITTDNEGTVAVRVPRGDPLAEQLTELGAAARGEGTMEVDAASGLRAVAVVIAAVRSAAERGAEVDLAELLADEGATSDEVRLLIGA